MISEKIKSSETAIPGFFLYRIDESIGDALPAIHRNHEERGKPRRKMRMTGKVMLFERNHSDGKISFKSDPCQREELGVSASAVIGLDGLEAYIAVVVPLEIGPVREDGRILRALRQADNLHTPSRGTKHDHAGQNPAFTHILLRGSFSVKHGFRALRDSFFIDDDDVDAAVIGAALGNGVVLDRPGASE